MHFRNILKIVLSILLLLLCIQALTACRSDDRFRSTDGRFFEVFFSMNRENDPVIHAVDAYYYDGWYYYCVDHSYVSPVTGERTTLSLVFYGEGTVNPTYLNPSWETFGDLLYRSEHYRVAVREGEHKAFSTESIETYSKRWID